MKICAYGICKNEIQSIKELFNSEIQQADYICFLDTGSTDGTWEWLQEQQKRQPNKIFIAQEEIKPWAFDVARNKSTTLIPSDTDVCLSIDADDIPLSNWRSIIEKHINNGYTGIIGIYKSMNGQNDIRLDRVSLYNHFHWQGAIHERIIRDNDNIISDPSFIIEHHQIKNGLEKEEFYLQCAQYGYERDDDLYDLLCLGYAYSNANQKDKSIDCFEELYNKINENLELNKNLLTRKMLIFTANLYNEIGNLDQAIEWRKRIFDINNQNSPYEDYFLYDNDYVAIQEDELAIEYYYNHQYFLAYKYSGQALTHINPSNQDFNRIQMNYWLIVNKMSEQYPDEDNIIINFINNYFDNNIDILDVGPFNGKWATLLKNKTNTIDAVEIFEPYVKQYQLQKLYNNIFINNIVNFSTNKKYNCMIMGDVLEHLSIEDAQKVIAQSKQYAQYVLFVIPFLYIQDSYDENIYQVHQQPDLTPDVIKERYPELKPLYLNHFKGYYILDNNNNFNEYYYKSFATDILLYNISCIDISRIYHKQHQQRYEQLKKLYINYQQEKTYPSNKVAIYAITKNEIKFVDKWMKSMWEADYIVVLDTGSTDGTYEKLLQYQAENPHKIIVQQEIFTPWRFDVPRNIAMSLIPEDANIILSTDLDEELESGWYQDIVTNWKPTCTRGQYRYAWSHNESGAPGRIFWYNKLHDWYWIWRCPVHELLYDLRTGSELYYDNQSVSLQKMFLHHWPDRTKSRGNYLPLLIQRRKEYPDDYYGLIYLCHEYYYRGYYKESIESLHDAIAKCQEDNIMLASCYLFLGDNYNALNDTNNAIKAYQQAIKADPTYREGYLALASTYLDLQQYPQAINCVRQSLANTYRHYSWLEKDTSWTFQPYDILSLAYYYSGKKIKSLAAAYKALQEDPNNERLKNNVDIILKNIEDKEW